MSGLTIRDPYGNTFEVDQTARPFWETRANEGYTILPGEPEEGTEPAPEESSTPKTKSKAGSRPAQNTEE
ncbi:hypothetical protein AB0L65_33105 [Nonomuraea sp. NPDC052116]|uniref:hypothetical protein n=1 Tax=Nonomuraea sp. NPDC052116 TaxID=3155665 RepID=UPI0034149CBB